MSLCWAGIDSLNLVEIWPRSAAHMQAEPASCHKNGSPTTSTGLHGRCCQRLQAVTEGSPSQKHAGQAAAPLPQPHAAPMGTRCTMLSFWICWHVFSTSTSRRPMLPLQLSSASPGPLQGGAGGQSGRRVPRSTLCSAGRLNKWRLHNCWPAPSTSPCTERCTAAGGGAPCKGLCGHGHPREQAQPVPLGSTLPISPPRQRGGAGSWPCVHEPAIRLPNNVTRGCSAPRRTSSG